METTERKIIEAAIFIFNADPSASLETVADKAGVNRRTLHRYFNDRMQLLEHCKKDMMQTCQAAMSQAFSSSKEPLKQLEMTLYAGIDCGAKYAFLDQLYSRTSYQQLPPEERETTFDTIKSQWFKLVMELQKQQVISNEISTAWIFLLFGSMISNTIRAVHSGDVAPNDVKKFAWFSFSKSIGIKSHE